MSKRETMKLKEATIYEVRASFWAGFISNPFFQRLAARYYAWKAQRKFKRYIK